MPHPFWRRRLLLLVAGTFCLLAVLYAFRRVPTDLAASGDRQPISKRPEIGVSPRGPAPEQAELAPANLGLQVSERLIYDIRVNGIPAGKSLLEVQRVEGEAFSPGPQVWVIQATTRSTRALSWFFYDVHDRAYSRIDTKGGFSRSHSVLRNEGEIKAGERMRFSYDIGNMEASYERLRSDGQWRAYRIPLTGKVLDPLAALYYLRALKLGSLQPGNVVYLPICAEARVWDTALKVISVERRDAGYLKGRQCVVFEPEAEFRGLFERKGGMRVWVDVATGIPLRMAVEIPIGPAEVVLCQAKGSPLPER